MSGRIEEQFRRAKRDGRTALVPFVTVGHPSRDSTVGIVEALAGAGADVIELGMPFSDPLAEGPVIQRSSYRALMNGITPLDCFNAAEEIRRRGVETPLAFMGYYNSMLQIGLDEFCARVSDCGVNGIIAADLPTAESGPLGDAAERAGVSVVPLLALTSTNDAIRMSCASASGFVYCISVLGVTGARNQISEQVKRLVADVRSHTELPVAVGFGISNRDHVRQVGEYADGAVVGSALVNAIDSADEKDSAKTAAEFMESLKPLSGCG